MKILAIVSATSLFTTMLIAQKAGVAAARPASTSAAAVPRVAASVSKPVTAKPEPSHASTAKPAQRAGEARVREATVRPVVPRWTPYWQNYCLRNPYAAVCQEHDVTVQQAAPEAATPTVIFNPYATTAPPAAPRSVLVSQTAFSAPVKPMVKVSDELAAGVAVGASKDDIRQKLGEPHSRISGEFERYTYFLQSGGSLKLDFADGRVTEVRKMSN